MTVAPTAGTPRGTRSEPAVASQGATAVAGPGGSRRPIGWLTGPTPSGSPWIVVGLWVILALPLAVALVALRSKHWVPIGDIAQTELRVGDVWSGHPPLIGLAGRIGDFYHQGSHPGPLSFWALWPVYRLLGSSPMALVASGTFLQLLAVAGTLWLAFRRGGVRLAIGVALILALLTRNYGSVTLTEPWNPFLPVMWWFLFLVAVWSVLCDDLVAFPVAVFAGSFCMQTHISYLGLVGGLSVVLFAGLALAWFRRRADAPQRRAWLRWGIGGIVLGLVLWTPPVIEQLTTNPGNGTVIWRHFSNPPDAPVGFSKGIQLLLVPLNPWWWINGHKAVLGSTVPGVVVLAAWVATAVVAWRLRHRGLIRMHIVTAAALLLGLASAAKIFGTLYDYLLLWAWGIVALLFLAISCTVGVAVGRRLAGPQRDRRWVQAIASVAMVFVLVVGVFTVHASSTQFRAARVSEDLRQLIGPTAEGLASGRAPGGGRAGTYLVTWTDPIALGSQGYGLLNELERRGFHVGASEFNKAGVTPHRLLRTGQFTAVVHLSVGQDIDLWSAKPGARRVAYTDLRTPRERSEYAHLRSQVISELKAAHQVKVIPEVDLGLYGAAARPNLPPRTVSKMLQMLQLGLPTAVFVGPPSTNA